MTKDLLLITALAVIFLTESLGKPTEITTNPDTLDSVISTASNSSESGTTREQRSPQFGLLDDYDDYTDYDDNSRRFFLGHKRKFHKPHHKPFGFIGGHGCRGFGCGGGWNQGYGGHFNGQGSSFATASAGSTGGGGSLYGGHSEANAQSATFNLGPYSATFSVAQASSGRRRF